jgi:hypothetical protein
MLLGLDSSGESCVREPSLLVECNGATFWSVTADDVALIDRTALIFKNTTIAQKSSTEQAPIPE